MQNREKTRTWIFPKSRTIIITGRTKTNKVLLFIPHYTFVLPTIELSEILLTLSFISCEPIISSLPVNRLFLYYLKQIIPLSRFSIYKSFNISKMQEFTYEQIREKALRQGVKDNRVHIGLWANINNYLKTRRKKNGKVTTYYISLQKLAY